MNLKNSYPRHVSSLRLPPPPAKCNKKIHRTTRATGPLPPSPPTTLLTTAGRRLAPVVLTVTLHAPVVCHHHWPTTHVSAVAASVPPCFYATQCHPWPEPPTACIPVPTPALTDVSLRAPSLPAVLTGQPRRQPSVAALTIA
jgi:hypothetical protein